MKRLPVLVAIIAVVVGISYLPAASGSRPRSAGGVQSRTVARGLHVGQRISAPRFARKVRRYQWLRCNLHGGRCVKIARATHRTYVVRAGDVGHRLRVRAVLAGSAVAVSQPTPAVGRATPVDTVAPVISDGGEGGGTIAGPIVGDVLTGSDGTWKHAVRFTYQWMDCDTTGANCAAIAGATTNTYTLQDADAGHTIVFQVTAFNS